MHFRTRTMGFDATKTFEERLGRLIEEKLRQRLAWSDNMLAQINRVAFEACQGFPIYRVCIDHRIRYHHYRHVALAAERLFRVGLKQMM